MSNFVPNRVDWGLVFLSILASHPFKNVQNPKKMFPRPLEGVMSTTQFLSLFPFFSSCLTLIAKTLCAFKTNMCLNQRYTYAGSREVTRELKWPQVTFMHPQVAVAIQLINKIENPISLWFHISDIWLWYFCTSLI